MAVEMPKRSLQSLINQKYKASSDTLDLRKKSVKLHESLVQSFRARLGDHDFSVNL